MVELRDKKAKIEPDVNQEKERSGKTLGNPPTQVGSQKRLGRRLVWSCAIAVVAILLLLVISSVIGIYIVPRAKDWLTEHQFIESAADTTDGTGSGSREVIVEENWVTDVVDQVKESVVSIAVSEVNLDQTQGTVEESVNIGTGFVIDNSGLVMTNQHVVSDVQAEYVVITSDGTEHTVTDIARDDVSDLAVLSIEGDGLTALPLGDSTELQVGQYVVAIGTPLGDFPGSVTTGVISGLGRSVTASSGGFWGTSRTYEDVIQTDAAINPGNSGGPLLDASGGVIGINFATTSGADNISFAIPINHAKIKIAEFKTHGRFIKPYLGVEYQLISQSEAMFYNNVVPGALVKRVVVGSPAEDAGIKKGDIITKIEGELVTSAFSYLIQQHDVGETIELTVWKDGQSRTVSAVLSDSQE